MVAFVIHSDAEDGSSPDMKYPVAYHLSHNPWSGSWSGVLPHTGLSRAYHFELSFPCSLDCGDEGVEPNSHFRIPQAKPLSYDFTSFRASFKSLLIASLMRVS
jgi:hypothetical protein